MQNDKMTTLPDRFMKGLNKVALERLSPPFFALSNMHESDEGKKKKKKKRKTFFPFTFLLFYHSDYGHVHRL